MEQTKKPSSVLILIALTLLIALFVFFTYTFLHEGGHAIAGTLFGQTLTEFDVSFWNFSAHVSMAGGTLTQSQLAVRAAAGAGLPLLIWTIFICLVPRKGTFTLEVLKLISSMAVVNTLLPWIVLPVLFALGKAPSDDVTYFLRYSQMHPLLLTVLALGLYTGGWALFLAKIDGLGNQFRLFSTADRAQLTAGTRTSVPVMAAVMTVCIAFVFTLSSLAGKNSALRFLPPQGFSLAAQIDLSTQDYSSESLTQFTLDEPAYVGVFISIRDINTTYFDLRLTGADGFSSLIVHGEGYRANQDGGLWEERLPAGTYQVVLTSHQSPGSVSIYIKPE